MVLGLISDVHANVVALEAVLAQLRRQSVDTIICLGDLVGYGPAPNETIELLRQERVLCTLGAADERIAFEFADEQPPRAGVADAILEWTRKVIASENLEYLRGLPVQHRLLTPAGRFRFFFGTLDMPSQRLDMDENGDELTQLLVRNRCRLIGAGGTHIPFYQKLPAGVVLNPGSVGLSLNGEPGADYAVIRATVGDIEISMGKVRYDFARVAADVLAGGLPAVVAEAIQHGGLPEDMRD